MARQNWAGLGLWVQPPIATDGAPKSSSSCIMALVPVASPGKMPKALKPCAARLSRSLFCRSNFHSWGTLYSPSLRLKSLLASAAACSQGAKNGWGPPGTSASLTSAASADGSNIRPAPKITARLNTVITAFESRVMMVSSLLSMKRVDKRRDELNVNNISSPRHMSQETISWFTRVKLQQCNKVREKLRLLN